ncbi:MAG: 2-amino-4-hydroxy-6-hydroxymethyldihydropteridine diphosphokinase [Anaerolineae bacterium]|nr:2-amino-4-hydroxy-6-hydroxymethyldihydropteridine diphosphokinase [Anaerolineae bacterium]
MSGKDPAEIPTYRIFLGIGSNIDPERNIPAAINELSRYGAITLRSSNWLSPALGFDGPDFLNSVILILTELHPEKFKSQVINRIEADLGRVRGPNKNAPRTIDLDILLVDDQVYDQEIWNAPHLTVPLSEIHPNLSHPQSGQGISELAQNMIKGGKIAKVS